ncbi:MAG: SGNH/GDSL hydrolase family protein [Actinomycetota bacterium]|nr:SGNH/GDSL hydrolase family protein [Actinomycetota bacterium]
MILPATSAGAVDPLPSYVALGDSYTAGPLIPLQEQPYGCLRSTNNYPKMVAPSLGLARFRDVSCSGADTADMTKPQGVTPGPNPPQFDALDAGTRIVSIQIGGNDIGFSSIAQDCFSPTPLGSPCQDAYVVNGRDEISERIAAAGPLVGAAFAGIKVRAPNARVFALNYPAIFPEDGGLTCWPQLPIATADIPYLRAKQKELNDMVAAQAAANGAILVDVYTPSIGRDACSVPVLRWVEPVVVVNAAAPVHPNLTGMQGMAAVLKTAIAANP